MSDGIRIDYLINLPIYNVVVLPLNEIKILAGGI